MARSQRKILSILLSLMLALSALPAPALAEMAEEAMGEEPVATEPAGDAAPADQAGDATLGDDAMSEAPAAPDPGEGDSIQTELAPQSDELAPESDELAPEADEGEIADGAGTALSTQALSVYNPRIAAKSGMNSGQIVTWDCVWFGSYPQTEVAETDALRKASWASRNEADTSDAKVGGVWYRRISRDDATYSGYWPSDAGTYRYFRFEPIKWRILRVSGTTALAVADVELDCRPYHRSGTSVTWETSTMRSWLNGTGGPYFRDDPSPRALHYGFSDVALPGDMLTLGTRLTTVTNANGTYNNTPGGNVTSDRVFLLSESEVHGSTATASGFANDRSTDEARRCKATDYARAMGAYTSSYYNGCYWWWLRSPGYFANYAARVDDDGAVDRYGDYVHDDDGGVRPALNLNLSSSYLSWAGTVSSDGAVDTSAKPGSVKPFPDVPADSWCANVVYRATTLGFMSGYDSGNFGPNDNITRGQVAVVLWAMAGKPAAGSGAKSFSDAKSGAYYYDAVRWASSKGVVSGYGNGRFGPDDKVTREQLAVMLANYAGAVAGRDASGSAADFASMRDRDKVSGWAAASVGWCFRSGILSGTADGCVNPQGNATRAEAAKMVVFLHDLLA